MRIGGVVVFQFRQYALWSWHLTNGAKPLPHELGRKGGAIGTVSICGGLAQGDGAVVQVESK